MQTQGFRFSFTPLPGSFSPFLHSTLLYRSLGSVQPCGVVPAPSHGVSRAPWYSGSCCAHGASAYGAITLYGRPSQGRSASAHARVCSPEPRRAVHAGLGSSGSARRYSRNRCFFLFLRLLRCFSSPGSPPWPMDSAMDTQGSPAWVSPFRYLRIKAYLPLPAAFRSLSRLSSALSAMASALCPYSA